MRGAEQRGRPLGQAGNRGREFDGQASGGTVQHLTAELNPEGTDYLLLAEDLPEAALAYEQAASLAPSEPERRFLMRRHRELGE